jgi:hypothetical protein
MQEKIKDEIPGRRHHELGVSATLFLHLMMTSQGEQPPALLHPVVNKNPAPLFTLLIFRLSRHVEVLAFNKYSGFYLTTFAFTLTLFF